MDENNQNQMDPMQPMEPVQPVQEQPAQGQYQQYQVPQPPYQQQEYQQPSYQQTAPTNGVPGNGFCVAALVLGILALLCCWIPYVNVTFIVLAIIFAIIGLTKKHGDGKAIASIVLSVIAIIPTIMVFIFLNTIYGALGWFGAKIVDPITNTSNKNSSWTSIFNSVGNVLNAVGNEIGGIGNEIANAIGGSNNTIEQKPTPTASVETKSSSVASPANMGEWTVAASYSDGEYVDTPFRVNSIARGADAEKIIEESGRKMASKLQDGCEWIVVDYSVDTSVLKESTNGTKTISGLSLAIRGLDGKTLQYAGKTYILTGSSIVSTSSIKTTIYNGKYVFQLPKGCSDYLIQAKAAKGTEAYVKGE